MTAPARDLIVNLVGRTSQLMGPLQGASAQMTQLGSTMSRTLTPAALALGAGMAMAGREYNTGLDAIRVGTGATGAELDAMAGQMRSLSTDATLAGVGVGRVGEILADVSTTTGATGQTLEDLTERFAQLERMGMGADVANVARVFGDWSIATDDQAASMDALFLAAQSSGATIDDLSTRVVQFGAPLRNLGFDFEEATALIASFQVNGVNLETVMGGLRMGIGRMARAGEDVPDTFRRVVSEIENTEDASEATRLAIELFGQRAGPDLADAIQNGQFAVEDMLGAIESGEDTIGDAAADTTRLGDKMAALRNRLVSTLGPFGEYGAVAFGAVASMGPLLMGLGQLGPAFTAVRGAFMALSATMMANPFVALTVALVAIGTLIYFHRDKVLAALRAAWEWIQDAAKATWNAIKGFFSEALRFILNLFLNWTLIGRIIQHWDDIVRVTSSMISTVVTFFTNLPGQIVRGVESAIGAVIRWFTDLTGRILGAIGNAVNALYQKGRDFITGLLVGLVLQFSQVVTWFVGLPGRIAGFIVNAGSILYNIGREVINGLWNGLKDKWVEVAGWLANRAADVAGAFTRALGISSPSKVFMGIGENIMEGLKIGMSAADLASTTDAISGRLQSGLSVSGGRGGGSPVHVTLVMPDGRVLAEVVAEANRFAGGQFR